MLKSLTKASQTLPSQAEHHEVFLYSLKDITVDSFGSVFEARSDDQAKRSIAQHQQLEPSTLFAMYPQDYQLWKLGSLDRNTGSFNSQPEYLCSAQALTPPEKA